MTETVRTSLYSADPHHTYDFARIHALTQHTTDLLHGPAHRQRSNNKKHRLAQPRELRCAVAQLGGTVFARLRNIRCRLVVMRRPSATVGDRRRPSAWRGSKCCPARRRKKEERVFNTCETFGTIFSTYKGVSLGGSSSASSSTPNPPHYCAHSHVIIRGSALDSSYSPHYCLFDRHYA